MIFSAKADPTKSSLICKLYRKLLSCLRASLPLKYKSHNDILVFAE